LDYYNLAEKKSYEGNMRKAYENYLKAAELSKNYIYYVKSAEAYYLSHNNSKEKNRKRTESLYNKSFSLKEWNKEGLLSRAKYNLYLARYKSSLSDLDSLLVRDSSVIDGYLLKASIYLEKKDTINAYYTYKLALRKAPVNQWAQVYLEMGSNYYVRRLWKDCSEAYLKAYELIGKDKFTDYNYCNLSSALFQIGKVNDACYYFKFCNINKRPTLKGRDELLKQCK